MSLELYDNAFKDKLLEVFPNVILAPPEEAFNRSNKDGKVQLPLISVWRLSNPPNFSEINHYEAFHGRTYGSTNRNSNVLLQALPITITYQVDIWAQLREYADGLYRELVYFLWTQPNLVLQVPNIEKPQDFALTLTDVDTSTDYTSFIDHNIIHKYTLTYEIPRGRLFYEDESEILIEDFELQEKSDPNEVSISVNLPT